MPKNHNSPGRPTRYLPGAAFILHLLLVIAVAWLVGVSPSSEAAMAWCMFMAVDFPVSVLYLILDVNLSSIMNDVTYAGLSVKDVWEPAVLFGLLGSTQYYFITWFLIRIYTKRLARSKRDKSEQEPCEGSTE